MYTLYHQLRIDIIEGDINYSTVVKSFLCTIQNITQPLLCCVVDVQSCAENLTSNLLQYKPFFEEEFNIKRGYQKSSKISSKLDCFLI